MLLLQKHPNAISALGWIALEREKNYSKAAAHFDEAFRLNVMDAGYYLGHMYQNGIYPNKSRDNVCDQSRGRLPVCLTVAAVTRTLACDC